MKQSQIGNKNNKVASSFPMYYTDIPLENLSSYYGNSYYGNDRSLPQSSIIISSPTTDTNGTSYDLGEPAVGITDVNGNLLPLSYTLDMTYFNLEGNKLVLNTTKLFDNNFDMTYFKLEGNKLVLNTTKLLTFVRNNFDLLYEIIKANIVKDYNLKPVSPAVTFAPHISNTSENNTWQK